MIEKSINKPSSTQTSFDNSRNEYNDALKESEYKYEIKSKDITE